MRINISRNSSFINIKLINAFDEIDKEFSLSIKQAKWLCRDLIDAILGDCDKCECIHEEGECDLFDIAFRRNLYKKCMNHDCTTWLHGKLPTCYHGDKNINDQ